MAGIEAMMKNLSVSGTTDGKTLDDLQITPTYTFPFVIC